MYYLSVLLNKLFFSNQQSQFMRHNQSTRSQSTYNLFTNLLDVTLAVVVDTVITEASAVVASEVLVAVTRLVKHPATVFRQVLGRPLEVQDLAAVQHNQAHSLLGEYKCKIKNTVVIGISDRRLRKT